MKFDESLIHGSVAPGFEQVKQVFIDNFQNGGELGAACAVYHEGKKVVDLWGGYQDKKKNIPWKEDTLLLVYSATKGMSGIALALAHSRGYFDYDAKVSKYWPEFAQNGKENITVRTLLAHQAGLCAIDEPLDLAMLSDIDAVAVAIAKQKPLWEPGKKHGYHGVTMGWYESAFLKRVDPQHRSIGQFFAEEIAQPLGIEFYIGLPDDVPDSRIATNYGSLNFFQIIVGLIRMTKMKGSLTQRAFSNPKIIGNGMAYNTRAIRRLELPASNGIGQVRDMAKLYGMMAMGGEQLGISPETFNALIQPAQDPELGRFDEILQLHTRFSLGFLRPYPEFEFGTHTTAFGTPGAGGSFGYADPRTKTGFAYGMNKMGNTPQGDPRERALSRAVFECIVNLPKK